MQFIKASTGYAVLPDDAPIPAGATLCTEAELVASVCPAPSAHDLLVPLAQAELAFTDRVASRCVKAGVSFPVEWKTYDDDCRNIANGSFAANVLHADAAAFTSIGGWGSAGSTTTGPPGQ